MEQMQARGPTRSWSVSVVPQAVQPAAPGQNPPVPGNEGEEFQITFEYVLRSIYKALVDQLMFFIMILVGLLIHIYILPRLLPNPEARR